jgi:uncharacterized membrane protein YgaE (UPF0421/DUF939 family)
VKIGYRTIKTAIATPIAIAIAQLFGVSNVATAGILAILCIQPSQKKSVEMASHRFFACLLSILFSAVFFQLLGYSSVVLALLLAAFIPTTILLKIEKGIITSTVITLNIYTFGTVKIDFISNQFFLIIIGIGTGLLVNLYMPSLDKPLKALQKKLEDKFQIILLEIARFIREEKMDWGGKEITEIGAIFDQTDELVERDRENHMLKDKRSFYNYFEMRKKQFDLLQQMLPLVTRLPKKEEISEEIAHFFEKLSDAVHPGNTAIIYLEELQELRRKFTQLPLPRDQKEFETRASLFQLLHEMDEYLKLKNKFKQSDVKRRTRKREGTS